MNLSEKIEEIKKQPEHVRLRYVWLFVSISMVVVVSIWILSMKANIGSVSSKINDVPYTNSLNDVSEKINEKKDMLQSVTEMSSTLIEEGAAQNVDETTENKNEIAPEKSEISNAPNTAPDGGMAPNMFPAD